MNGGVLQLTLRQLRAQFRDPVRLAALAGIALVVGVSGPFGTFAAMNLPARLAYWALVVPMTYAAGFMGSVLTQPTLARRPEWQRVVLASLASCVAVSLFLLALNLSLGLSPFDQRTLIGGFASVYVICLAIEVMGSVVATRRPQAPPTAAAAAPTAPALLQRLPLEKRGPLICLTVQDHYVEVTTTKGRALVLMRLSDAITECAPIPGVQCHRSHWVALSQVTAARRQGDAAILTLSNGAELPVARTRLRDVQEAGLLPRTPGQAGS